MKSIGRGFTLIEVSLFLAISGLLFLGVTVGVQNSIRQQRFNDSVQGFAEFLRTTYSEVLNVQNYGGENGRSDRAMYGRMMVFKNDTRTIEVYDVIGNVGANDGGSVLAPGGRAITALSLLNVESKSANINSYTPRWSAEIQNPDRTKFVGTVLIVRHPDTGTVNTYYSRSSISSLNVKNIISSEFNIVSVDFCVNPEPDSSNSLRRDVRIFEGARNASGVEVIADDREDNEFK